MAGLTFKNDVNLNINGEEFSFDSTDIEFIARIEKYPEDVAKVQEKLGKEEDKIKGLRKLQEFLAGAIDNLLGEGACKRIFKDETFTINKGVEIINYLNEEIRKAREVTMQKYAPNRAERRAKK